MSKDCFNCAFFPLPLRPMLDLFTCLNLSGYPLPPYTFFFFQPSHYSLAIVFMDGRRQRAGKHITNLV